MSEVGDQKSDDGRQARNQLMIKFHKIEHDVGSLFPALVEELARDPVIDVLYLYGSRVVGPVTPLSDVDLAVLVAPTVEKDRLFDLHLRLIGDATRILQTDEADLQIVNSMPVQMQYSVLQSKRVLFCRDEVRRVNFESSVLVRYLDLKPMLEEQFRAMHRRILDGEFARIG